MDGFGILRFFASLRMTSPQSRFRGESFLQARATAWNSEILRFADGLQAAEAVRVVCHFASLDFALQFAPPLQFTFRRFE